MNCLFGINGRYTDGTEILAPDVDPAKPRTNQQSRLNEIAVLSRTWKIEVNVAKSVHITIYNSN